MKRTAIRRKSRRRAGAALFEAVVALAILGIIGSAGAMSAFEMTRTVARTQLREELTRSAARLLAAVSLWPRDDLDRHLGTTNQGPMKLWVDRVEPTLYRVTVTHAATGVLLLQSAIYLPTPDR